MTAPPLADVVADARGARARLARPYLDALCAGHFPGDPIVPGAYVAGLMAAIGAVLPAVRSQGLALACVERCTFLAPLRPGDDVELTADPPEPGATGVTVATEVRAGGRCVARGRLRFA